MTGLSDIVSSIPRDSNKILDCGYIRKQSEIVNPKSEIIYLRTIFLVSVNREF
jgi:hypothetical protein